MERHPVGHRKRRTRAPGQCGGQSDNARCDDKTYARHEPTRPHSNLGRSAVLVKTNCRRRKRPRTECGDTATPVPTVTVRGGWPINKGLEIFRNGQRTASSMAAD